MDNLLRDYFQNNKPSAEGLLFLSWRLRHEKEPTALGNGLQHLNFVIGLYDNPFWDYWDKGVSDFTQTTQYAFSSFHSLL